MDQPPSRTPAQVHTDVVAAIHAGAHALNLSERALAQRAAIPHSTYMRRVSWGKPFDTDELTRIAAVLHLDVADLLAPATAPAPTAA